MQFVVVKFLPGDDSGKDLVYDIGLSKWIVAPLDNSLKGEIKWPEDDEITGSFARLELDAQNNWSIVLVQVQRFHGKSHIWEIHHWFWVCVCAA